LAYAREKKKAEKRAHGRWATARGFAATRGGAHNSRAHTLIGWTLDFRARLVGDALRAS